MSRLALILMVLGCSSAQAATERYSRDKFGKGWADVDHDCKDTRAELLTATSLVPVTYSTTKKCYVSRGLWVDYYTQTLQRNPRLLDIDHVVPLAEAWRSGAAEWSQEQREDFANEPRELVVTLSSINQSKSDRRPDSWIPSNPVAKCEYLVRWQEIKDNWGLSIAPEEKIALEGCRE